MSVECQVNVKSPSELDIGGRETCRMIVSRSMCLSQICACDGVTIWDERDKPLTGAGRRE